MNRMKQETRRKRKRKGLKVSERESNNGEKLKPWVKETEC